MTVQSRPEEAIFEQARERTNPHERAALVEQACAGDEPLKRRVLELLAAHDASQGPLDVPPPGLGVTQASSVERPGTQIGPYKLIEQIGEGGMGTVWMAQQSEPVKRLVALKVIKPGMDSRQVIARFEAERQALALMDHPNIARVLDGGTVGVPALAGTSEDRLKAGLQQGLPYFVMDLVRGVPITQYCDEHHLTPKQRLELFLPVCQAVQHAHQKGIIHRDLKPSNVLVALYDGRPVPKVIDFGVAKAAGQPLTEQTLVTGFGNIVGTLEYMSPEQAELNQLDIDTRSDIYSLGVLLYELLTGSPPFTRKELEQAGMLEMLRVIREQEPSKPSTKLSTAEGLPTLAANRGTEPAKLTKLVRGELDWIVMKALEKDRNRRYETANGFAADVQRYLADEPVLACPPSAAYRLRKFARRNKGRLAAVAILAAALLVAVSGIGWAIRDRQAREADIARQKSERQQRLTTQVDSILGEAHRLMTEQKWPEALAAAKRAEAAIAGGEADANTQERVRERLKDCDFIDRLERRQRAGNESDEEDRAYSQAFRDYGVDIDALSVETSIERFKARPTLATPIAAALDNWVSTRRRVSEKDAAGWKRLVEIANGIDPDPLRNKLRSNWEQPIAEVQDDVRRLAESIDVQKEHPVTLFRLAIALRRMKDPDAAIQFLRRAQFSHPGNYLLASQLGIALNDHQYHEEALRYYTAAVSIRPDSWAYIDLGQGLRDQGKADEAVAALRKATELDPTNALAFETLGDVLFTQGKLDEAINAYRKLIKVSPKTAIYHNRLGIALRRAGKVHEANAAFDKAIEVARKLFEEYPTARATCYWILAQVLEEQGKLDDAIDACRKGLENYTPNSAGNDNLGCVLASKLGNALYKQGKLDEAIEAFREAVELNPNANDYANLGLALGRRNKWGEAIDAYRKAIELEPNMARVHELLGDALSHQKQWPDAIVAFRKAVELDARSAYVHANLGAALSNQGQQDEAIALFRKAIELDPKLVHAHINLASVLYQLGKLDEATSAYRTALGLKPDDAGTRHTVTWGLNNVAWVLATHADPARHDPIRAVSLAKELVELTPQEGGFHNTLGAALYRARRWKEAVACLEKSMELGKGGNSFDWFFLAMAHWRLGEQDKARQWFDKAIEWMDKNQPTNDELRRFRAEADELMKNED